MEEKILEIFKYINETTDNNEHKMIKLKLLIFISINNLRDMIKNSNMKIFTLFVRAKSLESKLDLFACKDEYI